MPSRSTERLRHRRIGYAGSTVAVEYPDSAAELIDFLFRHAPGSDTKPQTAFRISPPDEQGITMVTQSEAPLYHGGSIPMLAEALLGGVCRELAERSRGGLLFHAAGLAWRGQGVLLPGGIGAGKTTLAAWLTTRGLDYLSDELIFFAQGSTRMTPFTRPLNLKRTSRPALRPVFDFKGHADQILSHRRADLVPATLLNPGTRPGTPSLRLILFPRYEAGAPFDLQRLTGAQTGLALMECLVNARNLPGHGFSEVVRLARRVPGYMLRYRHFDQIEEPLEELLASLLRIEPPQV